MWKISSAFAMKFYLVIKLILSLLTLFCRKLGQTSVELSLSPTSIPMRFLCFALDSYAVEAFVHKLYPIISILKVSCAVGSCTGVLKYTA